MLSPKRKVLIALLAIDILFGIFAVVANGLAGWIFLNLIILAIWAGIRKRRRSRGVRSHDTTLPAEKEYGVQSQTLKGDTVKSKKEKIIADYLYMKKLRYKYEPPVYTRYGRKHRLIGYADFVLLDYDVYVEYWGLVHVDDPAKREEYNENMRKKKALYDYHGYKLISLYEGNLDNLDWAFKKEFRNATGFDLPTL